MSKLDHQQIGSDAKNIADSLNRKVIGQSEAIESVVQICQASFLNMVMSGRPIGVFLFLGPTGSGKTKLVEATAETLIGNPGAVLKVDCAEFQLEHDIARLIGSPPGYIGHRETKPMLSQAALDSFRPRDRNERKKKPSLVLFDEVEKASDRLWNLLLGILDKATLHLGDNSAVDFSSSIIFMTSNLGAAEMSKILMPHFGFASSVIHERLSDGNLAPDVAEKISNVGVEAARKRFTPEFLNRVDRVVVFNPLGKEELKKIIDLELESYKQYIIDCAEVPFVFYLTDQAKDFLLREGTDVRYGARHLKRAIQRQLAFPLTNLVATSRVKSGYLVRVDYDAKSNSLCFYKEAENVLTQPASQKEKAVMSEPQAVSDKMSKGGAVIKLNWWQRLVRRAELITLRANDPGDKP